MKLKEALDALENPPGGESTIIPWDPSAEPRSSANLNTTDDAEPSLDELLAMSGSGAPPRAIRVSRTCLPTFDRRSMSLGRTESFDLYEKMPADLGRATLNDEEAEEIDAVAASALSSAEGGPQYNGSPLGGMRPPTEVSHTRGVEVSLSSHMVIVHYDAAMPGVLK